MFHTILSDRRGVTMIFYLPYKVCLLQYQDRMNLNQQRQNFAIAENIYRIRNCRMPLLHFRLSDLIYEVQTCRFLLNHYIEHNLFSDQNQTDYRPKILMYFLFS